MNVWKNEILINEDGDSMPFGKENTRQETNGRLPYALLARFLGIPSTNEFIYGVHVSI